MEPKCKNCWDKGFSTVMEAISGSTDFGEFRKWSTKPKIYKRYCTCAKGKRMLEAGKKRGEKQELWNLYT